MFKFGEGQQHPNVLKNNCFPTKIMDWWTASPFAVKKNEQCLMIDGLWKCDEEK